MSDKLVPPEKTFRHYLNSKSGPASLSRFSVRIKTDSELIALAEHDTEKADAIMEKALLKYNEEGDILFEAAQYYAKKAEYDKAIRYYEASYAYEERNKPRFMDALVAIAVIYEIKGAFGKAAETYARILENLKTEWGMKEESVVLETQRKIDDMNRKAVRTI